MLSKNFRTSKQSWLNDLLILSGVLILFYFFCLGSYSLFTPDEGRYSEVAREMIMTGDYVTPRVDGVAFLDKPVLYYWLQATAMNLFGVNEWAIRIFPALLGIFGCLITYICGRILFNRRTGLLSAIILATTPLYFGGAHYADLNLEVAVFISATLLCLLSGIQLQNNNRHIFLFAAYIFAALAFLTKGLIGIAFPSMIAGSWIVLTWRWEVLKKIHLLQGIAIFFLLALPWYIAVQKANPEFLHYFFVTQQVTRFLSTGEFNNKTPFWFYLPIILIGAFPWMAFIYQAFKQSIKNVWQNTQQHQTELFLLLWTAIIFLFFSIPKTKTVGYILPIFPAIALLIGNYLSCAWENKQPKNTLISAITFIVTAGILAGFLLLLPHHNWIDLNNAISPYIQAIAIIFIASSILTLFCFKRKNLLAIFMLCVVCNVLSLTTLVMGADYLNNNSAKPLALNLKTLIQPQDEVITYFRYFQDVPIYLQRQVSIVADWQSPNIQHKDNWVRELWLGMPFQKTDDWLINENTFWQRWESNKRVFVFLNENYFDEFKEHANEYYRLGKFNDIILLSNKPTIQTDAPTSAH